MTDPRLDFLDRLQAATAERMKQVEQVVDQVGVIIGQAMSPDRLVTVTVGPNGALLDLVLDDDATDLEAGELAALVLATVRTATERAASEMKTTVAPLDAPLDLGPSRGRSDDQTKPTAFDAAIRRADRVADTVEDGVRGVDGAPR